jgi:signal transduction histidine kinase
MVPFELRASLQQSVDLLGKTRKGIALNFKVREHTPGWLVGDPHRLQQVLVNLLGNAVKFTEQGEISVLVYVEKEDPEKVTLHFVVQNPAFPPTSWSLFSSPLPRRILRLRENTGEPAWGWPSVAASSK